MNDFKRLNEELKRTIIINIHSVELARRYASRIIGMRNGEIVFDGPASEATDRNLTKFTEKLSLRTKHKPVEKPWKLKLNTDFNKMSQLNYRK